MKQLSLIILMWFSTLCLNAQQKFYVELFPISVYSNDRENYHERHRMPSKNPLRVFYEDGMRVCHKSVTHPFFVCFYIF